MQGMLLRWVALVLCAQLLNAQMIVKPSLAMNEVQQAVKMVSLVAKVVDFASKVNGHNTTDRALSSQNLLDLGHKHSAGDDGGKVAGLNPEVMTMIVVSAATVFAVLFAILLPRLWGKGATVPGGTQHVSVEIGQETTVYEGKTTKESVATIFFSVNNPRAVSVAGVEVSLDNQGWELTTSPYTTDTLQIGEHSVRLRAIGFQRQQLGPITSVSWTVLPGGDNVEFGKSSSNADVASARRTVLPPTDITKRPAIKDVPVLAEPQPSMVEHLVPSSIEALKPIHIQPTFVPGAATKQSVSGEEFPVDPELNGPFSEKQLIEMTPKKLRQALLQIRRSEFKPPQVKEMLPDDIRELLRTAIPVNESVCGDAKKDTAQPTPASQ